MINNIKDLDKLISLCRKRGVTSIKVAGVELVLSEQTPAKTYTRSTKTQLKEQLASPGFTGITETTKILTDELDPETLLFYSVQTPDTEFATEN
jgi:hypothetical protein